ncbi:MAG: RNA recognition motif domain-containing protein [Candidatus Kapaibacteriota bacterium]|jgi:RNA recognition motif-containing protein
MNIYVGNLPYSVGGDELRTLFEAYGTVDSASVVMDKFTGQARGFGFVEMSNDAEAKAATDALNGMQYNGRELVANEARPREERPRREFSPRGGGGGGYGGKRERY